MPTPYGTAGTMVLCPGAALLDHRITELQSQRRHRCAVQEACRSSFDGACFLPAMPVVEHVSSAVSLALAVRASGVACALLIPFVAMQGLASLQWREAAREACVHRRLAAATLMHPS